ncbi:MAG: hypothetical protein O7A03_11680, partial [Alphaproteobacteria bacterium]|nr:hypothetical protein [Alphaproteobacteria bacterium]
MLTALAINGCASSSETIEATYVSPMKYESNSCAQVEQEYDRILVESNAVSKKQDDIADNDSVAMGVGLILFWPALFF